MTRLLAVAALVLFATAAAPIARVYACSCIAFDPGQAHAQALANADVAFIGVVVDVQDDGATETPFLSSGDPLRYTFVVEEQLKGSTSARTIVSTARDSAACGVNIGLAERWRIYAHHDGSGGLTTGLCSGDELLAQGVYLPGETPAASPAEAAPNPPAPSPGPTVAGGLVALAALVALAGVAAWIVMVRRHGNRPVN